MPPPFIFQSSPGPSSISKSIGKPPPTPTTYHRPLRTTRPKVLRPNAHLPRKKVKTETDQMDGFDDADVVYETEWGDSDSENESSDHEPHLTGDDTTPESKASPSLFDKRPPNGYKILERITPRKTPRRHSDTHDGFLRGEAIPMLTPANTHRKRKRAEPSPLLGALEMTQEGLQTQAERARTFITPIRGRRFKELKPLATSGGKRRKTTFADYMDGFTQAEMGICEPIPKRMRHGDEVQNVGPPPSGDKEQEEVNQEKPQVAIKAKERSPSRVSGDGDSASDDMTPAVDREVSCSPGIKEATPGRGIK